MTGRFHDLSLGGQLLIWGARHRIQSRASGSKVPICVWQSFAVGDLESVYDSLCRVMGLMLDDASGNLGFARPTSCMLTDSEIVFIQMLEALRRKDIETATCLLKGMTTGACQQTILEESYRLVSLLVCGGHNISGTLQFAAHQHRHLSNATVHSLH